MQLHSYSSFSNVDLAGEVALPSRQGAQQPDGAVGDRMEFVWRMLLALSPDERARLLRRLHRPECVR